MYVVEDLNGVRALPWEQIDPFIFSGRITYASRAIRDSYEQQYNKKLNASVTARIALERQIFLSYHHAASFKEPLKKSFVEEPTQFLNRFANTEEYKVIRFYAKWDTPSDLLSKPDHEVLVTFADMLNKFSNDQPADLFKTVKLIEFGRGPTTIFDVALLSYAELIKQAEEVLKPLSEKFGVAYSIQTEPGQAI